MPPKIWNVGRVELMLIVISAAVILFTGVGIMSASADVKVLRKYLANAESVQPNFEKNIILYTTRTEKVFGSLMQLRPASEEDYVTFISSIEDIGRLLSLNVDIKSSRDKEETEENTADKTADKTISYIISFYGTDADLNDFVSALQDLPYFIRIYDVSYRNLDNMSEEEKKERNISLKIQLYIK